MEKSTNQIEKNVSASFGYVKKDMLMLNDAFSDLNDKVQHLSLNHGMLLEEIGKLKKEIFELTGKKTSETKKKAVKKTMKKTPAKKKEVKKAPMKKEVKKVPQKKAIKKVVKETVTYE